LAIGTVPIAPTLEHLAFHIGALPLIVVAVLIACRYDLPVTSG
jgi:hypothetical protein